LQARTAEVEELQARLSAAMAKAEDSEAQAKRLEASVAELQEVATKHAQAQEALKSIGKPPSTSSQARSGSRPSASEDADSDDLEFDLYDEDDELEIGNDLGTAVSSLGEKLRRTRMELGAARAEAKQAELDSGAELKHQLATVGERLREELRASEEASMGRKKLEEELTESKLRLAEQQKQLDEFKAQVASTKIGTSKKTRQSPRPPGSSRASGSERDADSEDLEFDLYESDD